MPELTPYPSARPAELELWLLDPANLDRAFAAEETGAAGTPALLGLLGQRAGLARWVLDNPAEVRGKRVLDFGAGSGVVALACRMAGASEVIACDLDAPALQACALNARLNDMRITLSDDYFTSAARLTC
ncbi:50S ribosomal protein L11 methyltransferase [Halopseudomonas pachastrellae]|nr:50S ribosomal protein L11 methyltransferase [Halopseudomonas pachastrellae]